MYSLRLMYCAFINNAKNPYIFAIIFKNFLELLLLWKINKIDASNQENLCIRIPKFRSLTMIDSYAHK